MDNCCGNAGCEIERLRERQRSTLTAVLAINAGMFVVEMSAGLFAGPARGLPRHARRRAGLWL